MNFSYFGVKDETELEQDKFSLSRPTFGKDNQLTVIVWKGKSSNTKYYIVKCSECLKDPELFGDGIFKITKGHLCRGRLPCGCSSHYTNIDVNQYNVRIIRECKIRNLVFHGFIGDFLGVKTRIKLECPKHGIWETSNITKFTSGCGCPKCNADNSSKRSKKPDEILIGNFISTGKFKEGTKFWRSERLDLRGSKAYWCYTCPVCSHDEYVKAGLCSGVFEGQQSSLRCGQVSCRCSSSYPWTQDQYEYRIKKKMQESNTTDKFVGFIDGFNNAKSKFTRSCKIHGEYKAAINSYLTKSNECPSCANQNQQECYINFVKDNKSTIALKFGIAKDSKQRIKNQNNKSVFEIEQHGIWTFPDVKSCKEAEKFIKQNLKCKILTKEEMPDGYTETTSVENLEDIIKIYEDFGGVALS